ncbi:MAG: transposase [Immundisolibacter sp.]|uniref:REP-associated tyrosine transposase n=1 Tax=Immundisolibacter sp. TaxID=1934948 RepID=UPI003D0DE1C4
MTDYRRARVAGGTWFFTVGLAERRGADLLVARIDALGEAFRTVHARHPFHMDAVVALPDHLHCVWSLPDGDSDYSMRWGLIKATFSRAIKPGERRSASRIKRGERGIWQRRFWEHCIRDDADYARHVDYIHWNPVKHGYVPRVADWPHSSFHRHVVMGVYPSDWGGGKPIVIAGAE